MSDQTQTTDDLVNWSEQPSDEERSFHDIEPDVIRCLANAADAIRLAATKTRHGYVSDYCGNALDQIKRAIRSACGSMQE